MSESLYQVQRMLNLHAVKRFSRWCSYGASPTEQTTDRLYWFKIGANGRSRARVKDDSSIRRYSSCPQTTRPARHICGPDLRLRKNQKGMVLGCQFPRRNRCGIGSFCPLLEAPPLAAPCAMAGPRYPSGRLTPVCELRCVYIVASTQLIDNTAG